MDEYIDREQAIRFAGYSAGLMYKRGYLDEYYALEKFKGTLGRIPAADVAPVVHGHWRKSKEGVCGDYLFVCSACGADYWESPSYCKQAHYCPNCGAKMD